MSEHRKIEAKPGDIIHVTVGIANLGDGQGPWIPTAEELEATRDDWEQVLPEGVKLVVTHFGVEVQAVISP